MTPWNCIVCGLIKIPSADHTCDEEVPPVELTDTYDI